jgi:hypothetical protein
VRAFNPLAAIAVRVRRLVCAGGAQRMSRILSSPVTLWICVGYLVAAFVTMTWHFRSSVS